MTCVARAMGTVALLLLLSSTSGAAVKPRSSEEPASPVLACEPAEIRLVLSSDNAASFVFTVKNGGGKTLNWKVESCPTWLTLDARQGSLGEKEGQKITLGVDTKGLRPGLAMEGVVAIGSDASASPFEIMVSIEVLAAAPERVVERPQVSAAEPSPLLAPGALALDAVDLMAGFGSRANVFMGVGGRVREAEFGILWSIVGDEEDWGEAYCGYRKTWDASNGGKWYFGGGLTLDFAVSKVNGSSDAFGAWYLHGGWQAETEKGRWGVDLRVSPAVMEFFKPVGVAITYGW